MKWDQATSHYFKLLNGVRQGDILSHRIFAVYVDDFPKQLTDTRSGSSMKHQGINHVMYADDICRLAPSALGILKL